MKRALISVSDKTGVVDFARALTALDFEIVSTGGTAKALREAGVAVTGISDVTGFPEILEGRVKTLHPNVHGGILAKGTPEHMAVLAEHNITPIDLVVVNLYPFQATVAKPDVTLAEAIENIDIGGPTMVRSAAKNHDRVGIVVNPARYDSVLAELKEAGELSLHTKQLLALEAFQHTAQYDAAISHYLSDAFGAEALSGEIAFGGQKIQELRYGENPHQKAAYPADSAAEPTHRSALPLTPRNSPGTARAPQTAAPANRHPTRKSRTAAPVSAAKSSPRAAPRRLPQGSYLRSGLCSRPPAAAPEALSRCVPARCPAGNPPEISRQMPAPPRFPSAAYVPGAGALPQAAASAAPGGAAPSVPPASAARPQGRQCTAQQAP